jgi:cytochrome P450
MEAVITSATYGGRERRQPVGPAAGTGRLRDPEASALAHIGGRNGLPLLGAMPEIILDPMAFSRRMVARHGPVYRFRAMGRWHVHVVGAEGCEPVLFDQAGAFSAEQGWGPLVSPLLPGALLTRDGAEHRALRRLMGEAFRHVELCGYRGIFERDIQDAIMRWQAKSDIDVFPETKRLAFDIAASTFLGLKLEEGGGTALAWFGEIATGLLALTYNPWFSPARRRALDAKSRLERLLFELIAEKRGSPGEDFLSRISLIEDEQGGLLPLQMIADTFIFLLVAAHDTMSSALSSCLYRLATEPEWAAKLAAELEGAGVVAGADAASAPLPLMDMFYKEALRLAPPAPIVWRRALKDVTIAGKRIPAGTMTGANIMMSHQMPDAWPDPLRFDPFRFTPEAERERHRFAYVPFGAGVHKCLGMHFAQQQARMFIAGLLLKCDVSPVGQIPDWYAWPSARPRGKLRVSVDRRSRER